MKEYAIFDLDGTLIDSFECICRNINKALLYFDCSTCTTSQFEEYRNNDLGELSSVVVQTALCIFCSIINIFKGFSKEKNL